MFKTNFSGHNKFGGHKKFGEALPPNATPWLRAWLCVNHTHSRLNWLSEFCFRCHNISAREFFSALAHIKQETRNQSKVEHEIRLAPSNTQPPISKLAIRLQSLLSLWKYLRNSISVWN